MSTHDDDVWLDALAGREAAAGDGAADDALTSTRAEARALRALLRVQGLPPIEVAATDAAREAQLLERARREGVLGERAHSTRALRHPWGSQNLLAAAAVLIVAVGIGAMRLLIPIPSVRGAPNAIVHLLTPDPQGLKRELTQQLGALGVQVTGYERMGHPGIDADLAQPVPEAVRTLLERHHIMLPPDGALTIEFDAPDTP